MEYIMPIIECVDKHEGFFLVILTFFYFAATAGLVWVAIKQHQELKRNSSLIGEQITVAAIAAKLSSLPTLIEQTRKQLNSFGPNGPPTIVGPLVKRLGTYETDLPNLYNRLSNASNTNPVTD